MAGIRANIIAPLIAVVVFNAPHTNVLKKTIPKRAVKAIRIKLDLMQTQLSRILVQVKGNNIIVAKNQRQKAKPTGGISVYIARATTKFPDQAIAAIVKNR